MVGFSSTLNIELSNTGNALLDVNSIYSSLSVFEPAFTDTTIQIGETISLPLIFTPTSAESYEGILTIESNDPDDSIVSISLLGTVLPTDPDIYAYPNTIDFGNVKK